MTIKIRDSGNTLRTITRIRVRDAGNVLRTIQRVRIRDAGNVLRTVWEAVAFALSGGTYTDATGGGSAANTYYRLTSTGTEDYQLGSSGYVNIGNWITPNTTASSYECKMDLVSGTFSAGTVASWLSLAATQIWRTSATVGSIKTTSATISIRNATTLVVVATASVTLEADAQF
jgi:hypothetical protein